MGQAPEAPLPQPVTSRYRYARPKMSVTSIIAELRSENAELLRRLARQEERIKRLEELTAPAAPEPMTQWTYNGITYWRSQRNELWHQTFERDIGAWVGIYDPARNTIIMGLPEPAGVHGPIAPAAVQKDSAPAPRRSTRLSKRKEQTMQTIRSMLNEFDDIPTAARKVEMAIKLFNYIKTNRGNIHLLFAECPRFKVALIEKCKDFQKEKNYPALIDAATELLELYT